MSNIIFETLFPGEPSAMPSATSGNGLGNDTWETTKKWQFDQAVFFNGGVSGLEAITATSATAFQVGQNLTNPALNVDTSATNAVTGLNIVSKAASGRLVLQVTSTNAAEDVAFDSRGAGKFLINALTGTGGVQIGGTATVTSPGLAIRSQNVNALSVGFGGTANPAFNVDTSSSASAVTGINIASQIAGSGVNMSVTSTATNEGVTFNAKGSGPINIGNVSTGIVALARSALSSLIIGQTLTTLSTQNTTPTAAQLLGGVIEHASTTGAGTATLDTGTNISTAVTGVTVGDSFRCLYANTGNQTVTITTNTGLTLKGTAAIPTLKNAVLTFLNTGANAWTVYITLSA